MKQATQVCSIVLVLVGVIVTFAEDAFAQPTDEATRRCLAEVRQAMIREQIKKLYAGDEKKVSEYCARGDVDRATGFIELIGANSRCVQALDAYIEDNNLDIAKDIRGRAYASCRRGDLQSAIDILAGAPMAEPAGPVEILSLVASSSKVDRGGSVTLSWQTANANTVMLGTFGARDFQKLPASGSTTVSPDTTTTYVLMAGGVTKGPSKMESKTLQIQVNSAPPVAKTCSISGKVTGKLRDQGFKVTHVGVFVPGESKPRFSRQLDRNGRYAFKELPGGQDFRIAPFGQRAAGWRYDRRNTQVSCLGGRSLTVDLHVLGVWTD